MVERDHRQALATFHVADVGEPGASLVLSRDAARHAHVRRIRAGEIVRLTDGRGRIARATAVEASPGDFRVSVVDVQQQRRPNVLAVLPPVADRDRMLFAAEKCTELRMTSWQPVIFARSRSVSSRGEGPRFREKLAARVLAAVEQSGAAWAPDVRAEEPAEVVLLSIPPITQRILLDAAGPPLRDVVHEGPTAILAGPEGGLEPGELDLAVAGGWVLASLGPAVLRFETALVAATAIVRALQHSTGSG